jgi:hypothetical protein
MVIIETTVFTRQVSELLSEDEYRLLQLVLAGRPDAGVLIKGGGGLRKIRWAVEAEESAEECASSTTGQFPRVQSGQCQGFPRI